MGIFLNDDDFLPGVITEIESDYSLGYGTGDFGSTEAILLFGTAFNGPVGKPLPVYNPEHGEYIFGKAYNSETRKEASLAPAIKDAYDRGCRAIYAVRISGAQIYKDFALAADTDLRLRVSSLYPSNGAKDCYFHMDDSMPGNSTLTLYKPASFATIAEKNQGLVDDVNTQMSILLDIEQGYGLNKETRILEFIKLINEHGRNNVIRLGIVDSQGRDVTHTSAGVHDLTLGDVMPGIYFIGRDKSDIVNPSTSVEHEIDVVSGVVRKKLINNDDLNSAYPITAKVITAASIQSALMNAYNIGRKFIKDTIDYEEVDIKPFEIYKSLGSGYATTATLDVTKDDEGKPRYKVIQSPDTDPLKIASIKDGIYSTMENMGTANRVLTCGTADERIKGLLPKLDAFKVLKRSEVITLDNHTMFSSKSDNKVSVKLINEGNKELEIREEEIDMTKIYNVYRDAPSIDKLEDGQIVALLEKNTIVLKKVKGEELEACKDIKSKYVLGVFDDKVYIYSFDKITSSITPICDYSGFVKGDPVVAFATPAEGNQTKVEIRIFNADLLTLAEVLGYITNNTAINRYIAVSLTEVGRNNEEEYMSDLIESEKNIDLEAAVEMVDPNLRIPYTTTDNFARQLAQHCTYTSLKTAPTKGFIGLKHTNSVELESIAEKVDAAIEADFDLYAKKDNGRNMLDRNNLPYHIGRTISIPFMQYPVYMNDGYVSMSNGAAGYAGAVSKLPLDQSSTGQPFDIPALMYGLSNYQLTKLTKKGFVTCKDSFTKGLVITDGITMALNDSAYKRLSTIRIIGAIDDIIREATEPYIGKQNHIANRNALNTAIKSKLNMVKGVLIRNYDFEVIYDPRTAKFGNIDIDYSIVPTYEIRTIKNRISIKDTI